MIAFDYRKPYQAPKLYVHQTAFMEEIGGDFMPLYDIAFS